MKNIFDIGAEFLQLEEQLIESEGVLTPEMETALAIHEGDKVQKVSGYLGVMKMLESQEDAISQEIKRLEKLKKTVVNSRANLRQRLTDAMSYFGWQKLEHPKGLWKITLGTSKSVKIENEELIPKEFKKVVEQVDKKLLGEALKEGEVKGATIEEKYKITIR